MVMRMDVLFIVVAMILKSIPKLSTVVAVIPLSISGILTFPVKSFEELQSTMNWLEVEREIYVP